MFMKNKNTEKRKISFLLCPAAHVILAVSVIVIALYFLLRGNEVIMDAVCRGFVRPYHRVIGKLCSYVPFSVAELIYAVLIIWAVYYIFRAIYLIIRRDAKLLRLYKTLVTLLAAICAFYAGFCLLWGVYYTSAGFTEDNGIETREYSVDELSSVTKYFAAIANEYGEKVPRNDSGDFAVSLEEIFDAAPGLYQNLSNQFPSLEWPEMRAKPFLTSKLLSLINFTGFFFPFTAEANINIDSPACLIPSTIAHELAHQRGVATEDEANFVGILACMESGNETYMYSAALLAYIHLGNALYKADNDTWKEVYYSLSDNVRLDMKNNNEYWDRFETKISDASDTVYTGFLESYGEERGLQSYGACIDLLISYYLEEAENTK